MKRIIPIALIILVITEVSFSAERAARPVLKFRPDGRFKIVQFTDVHFRYDSYRSDSALNMMKTVIALEKPDLVVLTGDIVCSKNTAKAWILLSKVFIEAKVPWAITLGNHDPQDELTKAQIIHANAGFPYNLTENGPEKISGNGNYILKLQSAHSSKTVGLLYCLDSQMGFENKTDLGNYQWFDFNQVEWYRNMSRKFTKQNDGRPLPALAFFHIPLPEYKEVVGKKTTVGSQDESVSSSDINSGMYASMLECKDVMGIFVGHDHNNNYIGCLHNICLAFGYSSGRQSYGSIGKGARIIELYEGLRKFDTWVVKMYDCDRDKDIWLPATDRQPKYFVTYPGSFKDTMPEISK
jgi:predicted MPP superfamily phosphohydrolase